MKLVQASLSDRKDVKSIFHQYGGPARIVHPSFSVQEGPKSSFHLL